MNTPTPRKMKETHTPTPWKWNNGNLVGPDGNVIAEKNDDGSADAAFIVRAVNAHGPMLGVIKECLELLMSFDENEITDWHEVDGIVDLLRETIARAEGK